MYRISRFFTKAVHFATKNIHNFRKKKLFFNQTKIWFKKLCNVEKSHNYAEG